MANPLFARISPAESAEIRELIEFKGKIGELGRLSEIVAADLAAVPESLRPKNWRETTVDIKLQFGWLDGRTSTPTVEGRAIATMAVVCQRCLDVFLLDVDAPIKLIFVASESEWSDNPEYSHFDYWEHDEDTIRPVDLVEESLVMAIPLAPMHATTSSCNALLAPVVNGDNDTVRPFADLRSQLEKRNQ